MITAKVILVTAETGGEPSTWAIYVNSRKQLVYGSPGWAPVVDGGPFKDDIAFEPLTEPSRQTLRLSDYHVPSDLTHLLKHVPDHGPIDVKELYAKLPNGPINGSGDPDSSSEVEADYKTAPDIVDIEIYKLTALTEKGAAHRLFGRKAGTPFRVEDIEALFKQHPHLMEKFRE
ncbi:UNVERIFIED_CONTAM: hypothetical protein HDU68_003466 [Siphonaria sp. JEL0065]|nr:hypothetical protein HDU68_003466 [Siphonaria sp. JEL0065]